MIQAFDKDSGSSERNSKSGKESKESKDYNKESKETPRIFTSHSNGDI